MRRRLVFALVALAAGAVVVMAGVVVRNVAFPGHGKLSIAAGAERSMPQPGEQGEDLDGPSGYWSTRLTYPTGRFNPDWVRRAVAQDARIKRAAWIGHR